MATATKPMMLDETGKQIVDELKKIADVKGSAIGTTFDDTNAHLDTNNVQGAIDKLKSNADTLAGKVTTAEQNIRTNTQNIATNAAAISQHSSQIAEISDEIKVEKTVIVDDYALVESGNGVLNDLMVYGRSKQNKTSGTNICGLESKQYKVNISKGDSISIKNDSPVALILSLYTNYGDSERNDYWTINKESERTIVIANDTQGMSFNQNVSQYEGMIWVNKGANILPFEPYTGGIPSPNPSYPSAIRALSGIKTENEDKSESTESAFPTNYGIPVASGGNYEDKSGQKWISDVTNLEDGKTDRYCGIQELSELSWSLISSVASPYWQAQFTKIKPPSNGTVLVGYSEKYIMSEGSSASMILANNLLGCTDSGYLRCNNGSSTEKPSGLFVYQLSTPVTEPIPQATINALRQLRSFADKTHIYCDNGSLEAVIAENTEVGNAIGRNAIKLNEILNHLNPITASVEE